MIPVLFLYTVLGAALAILLKSRVFNEWVGIGGGVLYLGALWHFSGSFEQWTSYLGVDSPGLFFFGILGFLFLSVSIYARFYFRRHGLSADRYSLFTAFYLLFVGAMTGVVFSRHLALLWVFVEATTLMSAPFIYLEKNRNALEATWKYIFICSLGIAFAFMGIILLSMGIGGEGSLFFEDIYRNARSISPFWLKISFVFLLVGFGTKAGLAPVHAWLPDAHSEAPSPVSALLSGMLLNTAFLGILRVYKMVLLNGTVPGARNLLLLMGILSVFVAAVFMLHVHNYKRMLAYSSVENMGIAALALGLGGGAVWALWVHLLGHSLAKASLFITSGNILERYHTKEIEEVSGILSRDSGTGWFWCFSFLALSGFPPFPIFFSKFYILLEMLRQGYYTLLIVFIILLLVILWGMGKSVIRMCFGRETGEGSGDRFSAGAYLPQTLLLGSLLGLGMGGFSFVWKHLETLRNYFQG